MTLTAPQTVEAPVDLGAAQDRATRSLGGIARLLADRPELRGVLPAADLADDAIRWSA